MLDLARAPAGSGPWISGLTFFLNIVIVLSVLVALEHLRHVAAHLCVSARRFLRGVRPEDKFARKALPDALKDSASFPKVAIQLPMFNEAAVCQGVIDACCSQSWPASKLRVQVTSDY